jgi:hypothetical protein
MRGAKNQSGKKVRAECHKGKKTDLAKSPSVSRKSSEQHDGHLDGKSEGQCIPERFASSAGSGCMEGKLFSHIFSAWLSCGTYKMIRKGSLTEGCGQVA